MATAVTAVVLAVFRAVFVAIMVRSAILVSTVACGVLRSTIRALPGAETLVIAMAMLTEATMTRKEDCLFDALKIDGSLKLKVKSRSILFVF